MAKRKLRVWQRVLIIAGVIVFLFVAVVGGYVIYVFAQYYRIEDDLPLEITDRTNKSVTGGTYSVLTFNIGFGAYDHDFDFFLDTGYDKDGNAICGTRAKAVSRENVLKNTNGAISVVKAADPDFVFVQETDTDSDRSRHVDQRDMFTAAFPDCSYTFAANYHSANILYPFGDPIGASNAGQLTLSKYDIATAVRRSLPLSESITDNMLDLDRCIAVNRLPVAGTDKELVLMNIHMSAYDEGGKIRALQTEFLGGILAVEREKGNYVIVGGDFNQIVAGDEKSFLKEDGERVPDWIATWAGEYDGYSLTATLKGDGGDDIGTCRNNATPYDRKTVFTTVIDGFIVSDNVKVEEIVNLTSHDFTYSDHNPVKLTFTI